MARGKPFTRGYDPRRHQFTRRQCIAGYWAAVSAMRERHGVGEWFAKKLVYYCCINRMPIPAPKQEFGVNESDRDRNRWLRNGGG